MALVKYNVYAITISLDGATQEVYQKYRINGDFNKVIENIKRLQSYKEKYNSKYPKLVWQYIVMNGNDTENDIITAKNIAKELGIEMYFRFTWESNYKPTNPEFIKKETGLKYWKEEKILTIMNPTAYSNVCSLLWYNPVINYDGRLLGCCVVYQDDFGVNVFDVGLKKALKSKNYMYAKKMLLGKVPLPSDTTHIPCAKCEYYQYMLANNKFM